MTFDEYCKKNQHSRNCTRLEAFSMGQQSRQAEVDLLQQYNDDLAGGQCCLYRELKEKDKRIVSQNDFIEIALITLNHLKENAVTHRDYGHECNWTRSFNDLIKLASDAEDSLKEALRGEHE